MSLWHDTLLPRFTNRVMDGKAMRETRARVCASLSGRVLEIGFGSGLNVPHYPGAVEHVSIVEPSRVAVELARARIAAAAVPVEVAGTDAQRLDMPDETFDCVLSTWTLCTIPDARAALSEVRRVLKPEGRFVFVEHGRAPDPPVVVWQDRLQPLNGRLFGGCHLNRPIDELIAGSGLEPDLRRYYTPKSPKTFGSAFEGTARRTA